MAERWLSVDEIAVYLGVNPDTIYKWITRKSRPAHKVGRLWKFMSSEVDEWVRAGVAGGTATETSLPEVKTPKKNGIIKPMIISIRPKFTLPNESMQFFLIFARGSNLSHGSVLWGMCIVAAQIWMSTIILGVQTLSTIPFGEKPLNTAQ